MNWLSIVTFMDYGRTEKTGGASHIFIYIGITAIFVSAIGMLIWLKRKKA